uniref:Uncharacterized protein n=1 Tax=Oryza barthii TaxID=65489 RepID=A0A0D3H2P1_9ORYZ
MCRRCSNGGFGLGNGPRRYGVPSESLAQFLWANSDFAFRRGNPPEGTVEVPFLPRQGALGENLVQFFGRMTTTSFSVVTLVRASF